MDDVDAGGDGDGIDFGAGGHGERAGHGAENVAEADPGGEGAGAGLAENPEGLGGDVGGEEDVVGGGVEADGDLGDAGGAGGGVEECLGGLRLIVAGDVVEAGGLVRIGVAFEQKAGGADVIGDGGKRDDVTGGEGAFVEIE